MVLFSLGAHPLSQNENLVKKGRILLFKACSRLKLGRAYQCGTPCVGRHAGSHAISGLLGSHDIISGAKYRWVSMFTKLEKKEWSQKHRYAADTPETLNIPLMEEILHHLTCMKPCK